MSIEINYLGVLLAAAGSMLVGAVWYAPGVFGKSWAQLARVDMSRPVVGTQMARLLITVFLGSLVTAYVLAHLSFLTNQFFRNSFIQDAMMTAFWVWIGLVSLRIFTHDLFEGRRRKLTFITIGSEFATFMVMGLVIGIFKP
jgi:hypothetical protein